MSYRPKVIKKLANKVDHNGYSKNCIKFENKCIKCASIFIGYCSSEDDIRFKRFCGRCKHAMYMAENKIKESYC